MPENKRSNDLRKSLLEETSQTDTNNFQSPNSAFQKIGVFSERSGTTASRSVNSSTHTPYSQMPEENPNKASASATDSQAQGGCCIS